MDMLGMIIEELKNEQIKQLRNALKELIRLPDDKAVNMFIEEIKNVNNLHTLSRFASEICTVTKDSNYNYNHNHVINILKALQIRATELFVKTDNEISSILEREKDIAKQPNYDNMSKKELIKLIKEKL